MFTKKTPAPNENLLEVIDEAYKQLLAIEVDTPEYASAVKSLTALHKMAGTPEPAPPVDPNNVLLASANLFGIAMIVGHERTNVVTSKAIGFVRKLL